MKILLFLTMTAMAFGGDIVWKTNHGRPMGLWRRADGTIAYTVVWSEKRSDETTAEWIDRECNANRPPDAVGNYILKGEADFPTDWYFRDAWTWNGTDVKPHRVRAEKIHRDRLREKVLLLYKYDPDKKDLKLRAINAMDLSTISAPTVDDIKSQSPSDLTTVP